MVYLWESATKIIRSSIQPGQICNTNIYKQTYCYICIIQKRVAPKMFIKQPWLFFVVATVLRTDTGPGVGDH